MIGDEQKIYCSICGKYLYSEKEIELKKGSCMGITQRTDDTENYIYTDNDEFVCNECHIKKLQSTNRIENQ